MTVTSGVEIDHHQYQYAGYQPWNTTYSHEVPQDTRDSALRSRSDTVTDAAEALASAYSRSLNNHHFGDSAQHFYTEHPQWLWDHGVAGPLLTHAPYYHDVAAGLATLSEDHHDDPSAPLVKDKKRPHSISPPIVAQSFPESEYPTYVGHPHPSAAAFSIPSTSTSFTNQTLHISPTLTQQIFPPAAKRHKPSRNGTYIRSAAGIVKRVTQTQPEPVSEEEEPQFRITRAAKRAALANVDSISTLGDDTALSAAVEASYSAPVFEDLGVGTAAPTTFPAQSSIQDRLLAPDMRLDTHAADVTTPQMAVCMIEAKSAAPLEAEHDDASDDEYVEGDSSVSEFVPSPEKPAPAASRRKVDAPGQSATLALPTIPGLPITDAAPGDHDYNPLRPTRMQRGASKTSKASSSGSSKAGVPKSYQCTGYEGCSLIFSRSEHLARHIRKHTGERPFACHCGKAFSRIDNVSRESACVAGFS